MPPENPTKKKSKKKKKKSLPRWIEVPLRFSESMALAIAVGTLGRLGPGSRIRLSRILARIALTFFPFRKDVVVEQLTTAFPDMSSQKIKNLLPPIYTQIAAFGLEILALARATPKQVADSMAVTIEDIPHLKALIESKRGFVMVTAHMGNWEWGGAFLGIHGVEVAGAAKPMHDPVGERFIRQLRERFGVNATSTRLSPRAVTSHLIKIIKKGGTAALPADQDARHAGIFVDFLGKPAATFTGPAWLSYKLGVPLLTMWCQRLPDGRLTAIWDPPIDPNPEADMDQEIRRLTEYHVRSLERVVRADPTQYLWFHRRWKTKPKRKDREELARLRAANQSS